MVFYGCINVELEWVAGPAKWDKYSLIFDGEGKPFASFASGHESHDGPLQFVSGATGFEL